MAGKRVGLILSGGNIDTEPAAHGARGPHARGLSRQMLFR